MKKLILIFFVLVFGFSAKVFAQVSYPHPQGSNFIPKTVTPVAPAVNAAAIQQAQKQTMTENSATEGAVTNTQTQVNGVLNNTQTQQDLNSKTGADTTYQNNK